MAKKYNYSFKGKKEAPAGKQALFCAVFSMLLLLADIVISFVFHGEGGTYLGAIGLFAMLFSAYGFVMGLKGLSERNTRHRMSAIGSIAAGVAFIIWLALFLTGVK